MSQETPKPEQLKKALNTIAPQDAEKLAKQYEYVMDNVNSMLTSSPVARLAKGRMDLIAQEVIKNANTGLSNLEYERRRQEVLSAFSRELMSIEESMGLLAKNTESQEVGFKNLSNLEIKNLAKGLNIEHEELVSYLKQLKSLEGFDKLTTDFDELIHFLPIAISNLKAGKLESVKSLLFVESKIISQRIQARNELLNSTKKLKSASDKYIAYKQDKASSGVKADKTILKLESDITSAQNSKSKAELALFKANIRYDLALDYLSKKGGLASLNKILNASSSEDFEKLAKTYGLTATENFSTLKSLELRSALADAEHQDKKDAYAYFFGKRGTSRDYSLDRSLSIHDKFLRTGSVSTKDMEPEKNFILNGLAKNTLNLTKIWDKYDGVIASETQKIVPMMEAVKNDIKTYGSINNIPAAQRASLLPRLAGSMQLLENYRLLNAKLLGVQVSANIVGAETIMWKGKKVSLPEKISQLRANCDMAKNTIEQVVAFLTGKKKLSLPETAVLAYSPIQEAVVMKETFHQREKIQNILIQSGKSSEKVLETLFKYADFERLLEEGKSAQARVTYKVTTGMDILKSGLADVLNLKNYLYQSRADLSNLRENLQQMLQNKYENQALSKTTFPELDSLRKRSIESMIARINYVLGGPDSPLNGAHVRKIEQYEGMLKETYSAAVHATIIDIASTAITLATAVSGGMLAGRLVTGLALKALGPEKVATNFLIRQLGKKLGQESAKKWGGNAAKGALTFLTITGFSAGGTIGASGGMFATDTIGLTNVGIDRILSTEMLAKNFGYSLAFATGIYGAARLGIAGLEWTEATRTGLLKKLAKGALDKAGYLQKLTSLSKLFPKRLAQGGFVQQYLQQGAQEVLGRAGGPVGDILYAVSSSLHPRNARIARPTMKTKIAGKRFRKSKPEIERSREVKTMPRVPEIHQTNDIAPALSLLQEKGYSITPTKNGFKATKGKEILEVKVSPKAQAEFVKAAQELFKNATEVTKIDQQLSELQKLPKGSERFKAKLLALGNQFQLAKMKLALLMLSPVFAGCNEIAKAGGKVSKTLATGIINTAISIGDVLIIPTLLTYMIWRSRPITSVESYVSQISHRGLFARVENTLHRLENYINPTTGNPDAHVVALTVELQGALVARRFRHNRILEQHLDSTFRGANRAEAERIIENLENTVDALIRHRNLNNQAQFDIQQVQVTNAINSLLQIPSINFHAQRALIEALALAAVYFVVRTILKSTTGSSESSKPKDEDLYPPDTGQQDKIYDSGLDQLKKLLGGGGKETTKIPKGKSSTGTDTPVDTESW